MKICHVIYIPRFSGAEILVRSLAVQHQALGHQLAIVALMPSQPSFLKELDQLQAANISLGIPEQDLGKMGRLKFLARELKRFQPDVVVAHAVIPSLYARIAVKWAGLKHTSTISVLHDASQDDYASPYFRAVEKWLAPSPDAVVAVSQIGANNYCKRIDLQAKPYVITNGIDLEAIVQAMAQRDEIRQRIFEVEPEEIVFLQVGRFGSTKQQHLSLQAYAKAQQFAGFPGKICFVGSTEDEGYQQELRKLAKDLSLEAQCLFLGSRSDIPQLLAGADIYLMPSKYEAVPIAFMEALTSGISIIASDISALQYGLQYPGVDLISVDDIGLFAETIHQVVRSKSQKRWQRDLKSYSISETSDAYLKVFRSIYKSDTESDTKCGFK